MRAQERVVEARRRATKNRGWDSESDADSEWLSALSLYLLVTHARFAVPESCASQLGACF